nr:MAG TPA: hypothetical protein [Bacteriophage sp.]
MYYSYDMIRMIATAQVEVVKRMFIILVIGSKF